MPTAYQPVRLLLKTILPANSRTERTDSRVFGCMVTEYLSSEKGCFGWRQKPLIQAVTHAPKRWSDEGSAGSVTEMPDSGEDHGETEAIGGGDHVLVLHRPARLDDSGCSGSSDGLKSIGEREVGVGGDDGAFEREHGFLRAEAGGIHPAHLAGADADGLAIACVDDGVGLDVLANTPGKNQAAEIFGCGWTPGDDLELVFRDAAGIGVLQEQSAGDMLDDWT